MKKATPKRVDPVENPDDFRCLLLGALGQSTKSIERQVNLTPCQITYRLGKYKVKRSDYRNGESPIAQLAIASAERAASKTIKSNIKTIGLALPEKTDGKRNNTSNPRQRIRKIH